MASNFPSSLDTFTNPSSTDAMDSVSVPHATQHSDLNDAVEALQAKVGADSSAVTTSHDYLIDKQSVVPYDDASARTTAVPSPVEGQMSYLKDTNSVEVYDGSAWAAVGSNAMTLVATASPSAVTSVSIDNCFTSTYQNYLVTIVTGDPATNQTVTVRLRASSTDDSSSNYYRVNAGISAGGVSSVTGNTTSFFLGYAGNTSGLSAAFTVFAPEQAARTSFQGGGVSNSSAFNAITNWDLGGWFDATTQFDGFTVLFGANTTGVIRVYGIANS